MPSATAHATAQRSSRGGGGRGRSPFQITLGAAQRRWLEALVRKPTAQQRQVTRAKIVLLAAAGQPNAAIARTLGVAPNTARKWRKRYVAHSIGGLADRKRPGRPRTFPDVVVAEVKAIACELPTRRGAPISRWSLAELRAEAMGCGLVEAVSTTTLGRWLAEDTLRPWRHRSWIFPRDPDFAAKAGRVLDLYQRTFQGQRLRDDGSSAVLPNTSRSPPRHDHHAQTKQAHDQRRAAPRLGRAAMYLVPA